MSRSQPFRLAAGGAPIDRSSRLRFRFNGKEYEGHAGDTLASALMANGVRLVGRSFKRTGNSTHRTALPAKYRGGRFDPDRMIGWVGVGISLPPWDMLTPAKCG